MPENDRLEVAKMTIAENERGQGVGRQLLERVIRFAKERSTRTLYLATNTKLESAVRLYESVSFRHMPPERAKPSPYLRARRPLFVVKALRWKERRQHGISG
jgi:GNAT superfamily N-acetyltransferase